MRRVAALTAALVIATIAGCGGGSNKDPYQLVYAASKASSSDVVQIKVGVAVQGTTPLTISPDAFRLTVDPKTKRFQMQVELPVADLDIPAVQLQAVGVTGDTISADLLWDGDAVYLNSPVAAKVLSILMTEFRLTPPANLAGWLRLGTAAELAALVGQLPMPSIAPVASEPAVTDGASLKKRLEPNGITLTYVETVSRSGITANHVAVAFDWTKLAANPALKSLGGDQQRQLTMLQSQADVSVDLWLDASTSKLVEIAARVAPKAGTASGIPEQVVIVVQFRAPGAGTTLEAPATYTEVPLTPLIGSLVEQVGKGLFPTP